MKKFLNETIEILIINENIPQTNKLNKEFPKKKLFSHE